MSDDLISREALIADCKKYVKGTPLQEIFGTIIDMQPIAYNVDKVVEQFESLKQYHSAYGERVEMSEDKYINSTINKAIEIVKAGEDNE